MPARHKADNASSFTILAEFAMKRVSQNPLILFGCAAGIASVFCLAAQGDLVSSLTVQKLVEKSA